MRDHPVAVFPADRHNRPKVAVLLNMNARSVTPRVVRTIMQVVPPQDLFVSRCFDDCRTISTEVLRRGYDTVLTGGGDGTFVGFFNALRDQAGPSFSNDGNTVRAMENSPLPKLGVLRLGTGNALAGVAGASPLRGGGLLEDILHVRAGRAATTKKLELVEADGISAPFAGFGYDALVLNNYLRFKNLVAPTPVKTLGEGLPGYLLSLGLLTVPDAILRSFPVVEVYNAGSPAHIIGADGTPIGEPIPAGDLMFKGQARIVAAGTVPCFGFDFNAFPFVGKKHGRMQIRIASTGVTQALANLPAIWRGTWRSSTLHDFFADKVKVRFAAPMPLQIGGDAKGYREEMTFSISETPADLLDFNRT